MEENFRLVLIIISALVIAAIFLHGFWTIRKEKNPYKLKAKKAKLDDLAEFDTNTRGFDGSGFDQDGVSKARVISVNDINKTKPTANSPELDASIDSSFYDESDNKSNAQTDDEQALAAEYSATANNRENNTAMKEGHVEVKNTNGTSAEEAAQSTTATTTATKVEDKPVLKEVPKSTPPVYKEPVTNAKPKVEPRVEPKLAERPHRANVIRKNSDKDKLIKKEQLEINFDNAADGDHDMPSMSATDKPTKPAIEKPQLDPEVLIVSVVMPEGELMTGAALLPTLLTLGMKYGDMDIFHRHEDNAGNGKVTFSLANMLNPGSFNLDEMESITTQGVSLFMMLPNAGNPFEVFEQMFSAAKQLAVEFKGQVLDDKRSVMTKQTEQHYIGRIRDFERKSRVSG